MRLPSPLFALPVAAALLVAPRPASAQRPRPPRGGTATPPTTTNPQTPRILDDIARRHFELGNEYFQVSRYEDAAREFQQAYEISHQGELLFNMARAQEAAGNIPAALETYQRYDDAGSPGFSRDVLHTRMDTLRQRLAASQASSASGTSGTSGTSGAASAAGTSSSGASGSGAAANTNANASASTAGTAGTAGTTTTTTGSTGGVEPGEGRGRTGRGHNRATPTTTEPSPPPPPPPRTRVEYHQPLGNTVGPIALIGLGVAGGATAVVFGVMAGNGVATINRINDGALPWQPRYAETVANANRDATVAWIAGAAGGALVLSGVLWFALRGPGERREVTERQVRAFVAPAGAGAVYGVGGAF